MCSIYKISSPSGSCYIGSSINFKKRIKGHFALLRLGTHQNFVLQRAYNKYNGGLYAEEIFCVFLKSDLICIEQNFMDDIKPIYNISKTAQSSLGGLRKPVIRLTDNVEFESRYCAARAHGIKHPDNLPTAIKNGWKFAGHYWKFSGQDTTLIELINNAANKNNLRKIRCKIVGSKKAVIRLLDGFIFESAAHATREYDGYRTAIYDAIKLDTVRYGSRWAYV